MRTLRTPCILTALAALSCAALTPAAHAQTYIAVNTTLDASNPVSGYAVIGYANENDLINDVNPSSPTVNLVTGGSVVGGTLDVFNSSTLNVSGGSVGIFLESADSSTLNVSGGSIKNSLQAIDSSTVSVSGGTFGDDFGVNFYDETTGAFTLIGSNLAAIRLGADPNFNGGTDYALSGTLQGGTNLSGYVIYVAMGARMFTLQNTPAAVPEPGSVGLLTGLAVMGAGLLARRRARR